MRYEAQNRAEVVAYFEQGCRGGDGTSGALGVEVEHSVVFDDGRPVSYAPAPDGALGIRDVLEYLTPHFPQTSFSATGDLIGLAGPTGTVTLEPAAQLEMSVAPYASVAQVAAAYEGFRALVDPFLAEHGAHIESGGYHPTRRALDLSLIPKRRYAFMDEYFAAIGSHGERMMRASTSTQVSVDYTDETDAVRKMRAASALAPVLAAVADATRVFEGEPNAAPVRRLQLWREVDGARCGVVPGVFDEGFGFGAYADWLLRTSPIFVTRAAADDPQGPALRTAFDKPAAQVYADAPMGRADVEHLVSMFWPDVRLKRFVEIRPADCMPAAQVLGYTALVKGIFYAPESLAAVEDLAGVRDGAWPLTTADVEDAIAQIQAHGHDGRVYGTPLREWEELLFRAARAALPEDEQSYLDPLVQFAAEKPWWDVA